MLSYAHGACADPLLGETIGHNLERTIARVPDAEALVVLPPGCALHVRASSARRSTGSPAGCSRPACARATASASGARTAPSGR